MSLVRVGIPAETRPGEGRVAAVPATIESFVKWGWKPRIESGAGLDAGYRDRDYEAAGAQVVGSAAEAHAVELVLRVGPPTPAEIELLEPGSAIASVMYSAIS